MRPHKQRLRVCVTYAADAAASVELVKILFKLGAEGGVVDIVDLALEADFGVIDRHTAALGAKVRVIIHAEENINDAIPFQGCSEKSTHCFSLSVLNLEIKQRTAC